MALTRESQVGNENKKHYNQMPTFEYIEWHISTQTDEDNICSEMKTNTHLCVVFSTLPQAGGSVLRSQIFQRGGSVCFPARTHRSKSQVQRRSRVSRECE